MSPETLLQVDGLHSGYGEKPVLQGVTFRLVKGEIAAFIGRNGVGKSTLLRTLIGLLPTRKGSILYRGKDFARLASHKRALLGVGYVPQGRDVFPQMTVEENLRFTQIVTRHSQRQARERIYEIFPILYERRNQKAGTMSGGQQQQLAIGRALIGQPSLILLDEPSEGIQPSIVQEIAAVVKKLNRETGATVLIVEQNFAMISTIAQRALVMDKGRLVAELSSDEVADRDLMRGYLSV
ncbi:MAG TPA: ABC transporter ATP-binding protein [Chthoniobacterales bacterium]